MSRFTTLICLSIPLLFMPSISFSADEDTFDEIIVTSQRTEESLQDVPIAVTAFTQESLDAKQIQYASDLQTSVPGLTFSPSAFSGGGGFDIRGITNLAVSASSDSGVEVHMNDLPMGATTNQDGQFFDMERIEVLRGPQGTLFGRNSVGGVINLITAKADVSDFYGNVMVDAHDYSGLRTQAMLNIPLTDTVAFRGAYSELTRDGFSDNTYTLKPNLDIDNRDQYAYRASLAFTPSEDTSLHIVHELSSEDSTRSGVQNTICKQDPSFVVGCTPVKGANYELTNPMATLVDNLMVLSGAINFRTSSNSLGVPQNIRDQNLRQAGLYIVDQDTTQVIFEHSMDNDLTFNFSAHQKNRDFLRRAGLASEELINNPINPTFNGGFIPLSGYGPGCNLDDGTLGIYGGCIFDTINYITGGDRSNATEELKVKEIRISSDYDGSWNFVAGAIKSEAETKTAYDVWSSGLEALSLAPPALLTGLPQGAVQLYPSLYRTDTENDLTSTGIFGEVYYQARDNLTVTFGLRRSEDEKVSKSRQAFINLVGIGSQGNGFTPLLGSIPKVGETYLNAGIEPLLEFEKTTGKIMVDWYPTETTLVYGSFSTGFKGGGFNPAVSADRLSSVPMTFGPMEIDAFEVGFKSDFIEQDLRLNGAFYLYDSDSYHTTKIENNTSVNESVEVEIMGLELEAIWAPSSIPGLVFDAMASVTESEIGNSMQIDPINRDLALTGGTNWHLMKDDQAFMYIIRKDYAAVLSGALQAGLLGPAAAAFISPEFHGDRVAGEPTPTSLFIPALGLTPAAGHYPSGAVLSVVQALAPSLGFVAADVVKAGIPSDLSGNQLIHPEFTASIGAEYTMEAGSYDVTYRADYYHQGPRYVRLFNLPNDELDSWSELNLQVTIAPKDGNWYVQVYSKNATDEENIESLGLGADTVGHSRGISARDPQVSGMRFGINF